MPAHTALLPGLEHITVGAPINRLGISLIPVYLHGGKLDIATGAGSGVSIAERPDAEVPTLVADNAGDRSALLVDGEIVEGGLQTRVINVSVLVAAHSQVLIPVSCVEQGRWNGGDSFQRGRSFAPRRVRRTKHASIGDNVRRSGDKRTDQGAVWSTVASELTRMNAASASGALTAGDARLDDPRVMQTVDELCRRGPLPGQCGVVVTHGARIVSAELFATPAMLAAHWEALIRGVLLDAPAVEPTSRPSLTRAVRFLRSLSKSEATVTDGVGLGREYHLRTPKLVAQALVHDGFVVHASAFALAA